MSDLEFNIEITARMRKLVNAGKRLATKRQQRKRQQEAPAPETSKRNHDLGNR